MDVPNLTDDLQNFDILSLNETFVDNVDYDYVAFSDYKVYVSKAVKITEGTRKSGGVLVFVKKHLSPFVRRIDVKYDHMVVLSLDKNLLGLSANLILICLYIHPEGSKFWSLSEFGYGIEILEQCLVDLHEQLGNFSFVICGDLNSRTGSMNAKQLDDEEFDNLANQRTPNAIGDIENMYIRLSEDSVTNNFGKNLLELCSIFECVILNGMHLSSGQMDKALTYISSNGGSTIDYFIISTDICNTDFVYSLDVLKYVDSSHFPVLLHVNCQKAKDTIRQEPKLRQNSGKSDKWTNKLVWDVTLETVFENNWNSDKIQVTCMRAFHALDHNIEQAIHMFNFALTEASACMRKRVKRGDCSHSSSPWFDADCREAKRKARRLLTQYRQNSREEGRLSYVTARKEYKCLIKNKKLNYRSEKAQKLATLGNNSKLFWKEVRLISGKKKTGSSQTISEGEWVLHFQSLFDSQVESVASDESGSMGTCGEGETTRELNKPILEREVEEAIKHLKRGKAGGTDSVTAEMLKLSRGFSVVFLTKLFNILFDSGTYPEEWSKAIIVPIFKKGDPKLPMNYRGVSLLSIVSKCYTFVLNKRLTKFAEINDCLKESQAGFRKNYATIDHIFTLNAIIEKGLAKRGGKIYACFVDLKSAFDSVQRKSLFEVLVKYGIDGKFMKSIRSIYNSVIACVRTENATTDFFDCPVGVRQGCVLSPILFSLFINEITDAVDKRGMHGFQLLPGLIELFILLFADDIVLLSQTAIGLQNQIQILAETCKSLYLTINNDKTKVMVFRKGGFLGKNEKWKLNGADLDIVNEYNYLGFTFTTKMSLRIGTEGLSVKGKKACIGCIKCAHTLNEMSRKCFFNIFDTQVQPVLLYAAELWGLRRLENIEKVHTLACKRFLNVHLRVPNKLVYGELGRFPLYINSAIRCFKYWMKLLKLDEARLPRQAYIMLKNLDEKGKVCWATYVKETLFKLGFGIVWVEQSVGNEKQFLSEVKQRMIDIFMQEWHNSIMTKDIFRNYRLFKNTFGKETYLDDINDKRFRNSLAKLRLGVLPIGSPAFRRIFANCQVKCIMCVNLDDENHVIFKCPLYEQLRVKYVNVQFKDYVTLLKYGTTRDVTNLAKFLFFVVKLRFKID